MKHLTVKDKSAKTFDALKAEFGYTNKLQAPRITKVVLSATTGSIKDSKKKELIGDRLTKIAGQKATQTSNPKRRENVEFP